MAEYCRKVKIHMNIYDDWEKKLAEKGHLTDACLDRQDLFRQLPDFLA